MKVKGKIELKMKYSLIPIESKLMMIISFKDPFKSFHQIPQKIKVMLTSNLLQGERLFLQKSEDWLNNKERLVRLAEEKIKEYFERYDESNRLYNIHKKVKDINSQNIEVEIDLKSLKKGE